MIIFHEHLSLRRIVSQITVLSCQTSALFLSMITHFEVSKFQLCKTELMKFDMNVAPGFGLKTFKMTEGCEIEAFRK